MLTWLVIACEIVPCGPRPWTPVVLGQDVDAPASGAAPGVPAAEAPANPLRTLWSVPLRSTSFGGGAVAPDVDGNERQLEVAFASYFGDSAVRVLNGEDGTELWKYQGGGPTTEGECFDASLRFTDLDGDGDLELMAR